MCKASHIHLLLDFSQTTCFSHQTLERKSTFYFTLIRLQNTFVVCTVNQMWLHEWSKAVRGGGSQPTFTRHWPSCMGLRRCGMSGPVYPGGSPSAAGSWWNRTAWAGSRHSYNCLYLLETIITSSFLVWRRNPVTSPFTASFISRVDVYRRESLKVRLRQLATMRWPRERLTESPISAKLYVQPTK